MKLPWVPAFAGKTRKCRPSEGSVAVAEEGCRIDERSAAVTRGMSQLPWRGAGLLRGASPKRGGTPLCITIVVPAEAGTQGGKTLRLPPGQQAKRHAVRGSHLQSRPTCLATKRGPGPRVHSAIRRARASVVRSARYDGKCHWAREENQGLEAVLEDRTN